jgi:hypothetical protein
MTDPQAEKSPLKVWLVEWFALGNLAFLALDIYMAHSINQFAHWAEWTPVVFSLGVPIVLLPGVLARRHRTGTARFAGMSVGIASVLLGIVGMVLHLESTFFSEQTLKALIYAAPFAGPLSYTGVGLLLILNRLEPDDSPHWGTWIIFLALCGFVGNLSLSLCDHAQNGFFHPTEWISVAASAFAVSFLLIAVIRPQEIWFLKWCVAMMLLQVIVGLLGFALHLIADFTGPAANLTTNLIYGAPIFAPLLFPNLAILAAIGIWELQSSRMIETAVV